MNKVECEVIESDNYRICRFDVIFQALSSQDKKSFHPSVGSALFLSQYTGENAVIGDCRFFTFHTDYFNDTKKIQRQCFLFGSSSKTVSDGQEWGE
jgi:hypothetical protein